MLTSERIEDIQSRSRADYACLDAPGFRDSLAARRDVAALLSDRAEMVAELHRFRSLVEAHEEVKAQLKAENERLQEVARAAVDYFGKGCRKAQRDVLWAALAAWKEGK